MRTFFFLVPMSAACPGARAFVGAFVGTEAAEVMRKRTRARRIRGPGAGKQWRSGAAAQRHGVEADRWLEAFVHQGWLDMETACDGELRAALAAGEPGATSAWALRDALVSAGFVALRSQVCVRAAGLAPVVDLLGVDARGRPTVVEVKCGLSVTDACPSAPRLTGALSAVRCNGRDIAMAQLAVQTTCLELRTGDGRSVQGWLAVHVPPGPGPSSGGEVRVHALCARVGAAVSAAVRAYARGQPESL